MATKLTIFFTSDTHGYLYPTNFADEQPRGMGLLGMSFPKDGNTLVIDGGDSIQGSPLTYYCYSQGIEPPVAEAMNDLAYDYVTLGNHDFNNGYEALERYVKHLRATCLLANVRDRSGQLPIKPYACRTLANGLRVGMIGVVTDWVKRWERPEHLRNFDISDPLAAAREAIEALRGQADVLVGVYHGGFEKDLHTGQRLSQTDENIACRLCEQLPFDLLLTGHQHIGMANESYRGVHVVQAPCNATAYLRVTMDERKRFASELCEVPVRTIFQPAQAALLSRLNQWLDAPVGRLSRPIWPQDKLTMALRGSPIADFFNMVQLEASGADVSCTALGNEIRGFDSRVTVRDVVASYVYSNTLVVLEVTGRVLALALEQCAAYFNVEAGERPQIASAFLRPKEAHYNYDYFLGVEYAFDLTKPVGQRVAKLCRKGKPVGADERLTLCMSNYRATGAGDFDCYLTCPRVREIQTEISELILTYFAKHNDVALPAEAPYTVTF